uniref:Uncharacterized protein n=1 Tax=Nelumbo nucifera TaxID=4432 RepID=A0A822YE28_NELNU|nr:TPA_asm: hypothetical protein HUJ06_009493 [Nelumbo nucifera]
MKTGVLYGSYPILGQFAFHLQRRPYRQLVVGGVGPVSVIPFLKEGKGMEAKARHAEVTCSL